MKLRMTISCLTLVILLGLSLVNGWYAETLTRQASQQLTRAQDAALSGDWDTARSATQKTFQEWQSHDFYFHTVMRHTDTDQILRTFQGVLQYLRLEETDQYTAANADLITQIELLGEMECASLENVL